MSLFQIITTKAIRVKPWTTMAGDGFIAISTENECLSVDETFRLYNRLPIAIIEGVTYDR
jgi:hypothetical protein